MICQLWILDGYCPMSGSWYKHWTCQYLFSFPQLDVHTLLKIVKFSSVNFFVHFIFSCLIFVAWVSDKMVNADKNTLLLVGFANHLGRYGQWELSPRIEKICKMLLVIQLSPLSFTWSSRALLSFMWSMYTIVVLSFNLPCSTLLMQLHLYMQEIAATYCKLSTHWTFCFHCLSVGGVPVQFSEQPTNGITYFRALSGIALLPDSLKIYVPLFCNAITQWVYNICTRTCIRYTYIYVCLSTCMFVCIVFMCGWIDGWTNEWTDSEVYIRIGGQTSWTIRQMNRQVDGQADSWTNR